MAGDQAVSPAARAYRAFCIAMQPVRGPVFPEFTELRDGAEKPWFAVANALERYLEPPKTEAPSKYELGTPIAPIRIGDMFQQQDGSPVPAGEADQLVPEDLPTHLNIRPLIAADLCVPEFADGDAAFNLAIQAQVHEIDLELLEWRIDPADGEAANYMIHKASGLDAWQLIKKTFAAGGGKLVPGEDDSRGWKAVSLALFAEPKDDYYLLRCRTPGLGTVKVGPYRLGHGKILEDTVKRSTEWAGRLLALSKMVERPIELISHARIEDVDRMWSLFDVLEKKTEERVSLRIALLSSSLSTAGDGKTSSTTPETS